MSTDPTTLLGLLRTFITAGTDFPASTTEVKFSYPDEVREQAKRVLVIEQIDSRSTDWIGYDAPDTAQTNLVDKGIQEEYSFRIEVWDGRPADALEGAGQIRKRFLQQRALLLSDVGAHIVEASGLKTLPFDPNFPGWNKWSLYVRIRRDEVWTETPVLPTGPGSGIGGPEVTEVETGGE